MNKLLKLFLFFLIFTHNSFSQNKSTGRKGEFYVHWGYNQSAYSKSDIYFKGIGYEFTLKDVVATDRPSHYGIKDYVNLSKLTIPQYNLRLGYFLKNNWSISLGTDHMKYVMKNNQTTTITGSIEANVSEPSIKVNPAYVGEYKNDLFKINADDFLVYEHTDGFNFVHFEIDHYKNIWKAKNKNMGIDWLYGVGAGILIPRTDAHLFTIGRNHYWNIAGYGISAKSGLRFDLSKHLYLQTDLKTGFTDLSDVRTTGRKTDFAQQKIIFYEAYFAFGFKFGKKRNLN
jgi:hypothetical protein